MEPSLLGDVDCFFDDLSVSQTGHQVESLRYLNTANKSVVVSDYRLLRSRQGVSSRAAKRIAAPQHVSARLCTRGLQVVVTSGLAEDQSGFRDARIQKLMLFVTL